jgi:hypothetical protein
MDRSVRDSSYFWIFGTGSVGVCGGPTTLEQWPSDQEDETEVEAIIRKYDATVESSMAYRQQLLMMTVRAVARSCRLARRRKYNATGIRGSRAAMERHL